MNNSKDEVKSVLEKIEKQKEENEKKLEDEKKLTEANTKSHQAELQSKHDVRFLSFCIQHFYHVSRTGIVVRRVSRNSASLASESCDLSECQCTTYSLEYCTYS